MNVLSDFVNVRGSITGRGMKETAGEIKRPVEGYLIVGAALALLLGIVLLMARAS